jgi:uncharacterized protein YdeI (YjbR/CyaY-like superfamily)
MAEAGFPEGMKKLTDPRVDAYIAKSAEFARPILTRLRKLVRQACPTAEEAMKWGHPGYLSDGKILCIFSAFKAHCGLVFWHQEMKKELAGEGLLVRQAMGHMGRIEKMADLPNDATLLRLFRRAAELTASGQPARPPAAKKPRPELPVPKDLAAALKTNAKAAATFKQFAPSHRRAYVEWITGAKRDETRQTRLATTMEWLAEGKPYNWKYANC